MTPHKSCRPTARVACSGGSLMLSGPQVQVENDGSCGKLPSKTSLSEGYTSFLHHSPHPCSCQEPRTAQPRGVSSWDIRHLTTTQSRAFSHRPSSLPSLLSKILPQNKPIGFASARDMGSSRNFQTTQKSMHLQPLVCVSAETSVDLSHTSKGTG